MNTNYNCPSVTHCTLRDLQIFIVLYKTLLIFKGNSPEKLRVASVHIVQSFQITGLQDIFVDLLFRHFLPKQYLFYRIIQAPALHLRLQHHKNLEREPNLYHLVEVLLGFITNVKLFTHRYKCQVGFLTRHHT